MLSYFSDVCALTELFLPQHCAVCGASGCRRGLCRVCQRIVGLNLVRPCQVPELALTYPVYAAGEYDAVLARCILSYKEHLRTDIRNTLACGLARSISALSQEQTALLIPVPSSHKSIARRGFSPAYDLTHAALKHLSREEQRLLHISSALTRKNYFFRNTTQKQLGKYDRQKQIQGSMKIKSKTLLAGTPCILIDDVITTGASLKEASRVLEDAGAQIIGCSTLAWVRRQRPLEED